MSRTDIPAPSIACITSIWVRVATAGVVLSVLSLSASAQEANSLAPCEPGGDIANPERTRSSAGDAQGQINLIDPVQWNRGLPLEVIADSAIQVRGTVILPGGVGSVEVDGSYAKVDRGSISEPAVFECETSAVRSGTVVVRVIDLSGEAHDAAFTLRVLRDPNELPIQISMPANWSRQELVLVVAGDSLRVEGRIVHPDPLLEVRVAGRSASLDPVPNSRVTSFSATIAPADTAREIVVAAVLRDGPPIEERFGITIQPSPEQTAAFPSDSLAERQSPGQQVGGIPGNPWRGYRYRGIGYAVAAISGGALALFERTETAEVCEGPANSRDCFIETTRSKPYRPVGTALVAGAVAAGVLDAFLTMRRSHAADTGEGRGDSGAGGYDTTRKLSFVWTERGLAVRVVAIRF